MTVIEAISKIHAPKGLTSILAGISAGDYSVMPHNKGIDADILIADEEISKYEKAIDECKSDWAYWSILSDLEYWKAIKNILEAGKLSNGKLPDIDAPDLEGCVLMDAIGRVSDFGEKILRETRAVK